MLKISLLLTKPRQRQTSENLLLTNTNLLRKSNGILKFDPISASKKTEEKKKDLAKRCVLFMLKIFYIRTTQILMIFVNVFSSFLLGDAFCDFLMMFSYKDVDIAQISNHKC